MLFNSICFVLRKLWSVEMRHEESKNVRFATFLDFKVYCSRIIQYSYVQKDFNMVFVQ